MQFASPPLVVNGVKSDLGQVFLNLILNATDAIADSTPDGSQPEKEQIRILTQRKGDWAEVRVVDTGCGIDAALLKRIFDPFFTTKEVGRGTGQGLAIAYGFLTEEHSGKLSVESTPDKGVSLPYDSL